MNGEEPQGFPIDIWALGTILFKMLTGKDPFQGNERKISWPQGNDINKISTYAQDLVIKMLKTEPEERLGSNLESIQIMKYHPFFHGVNFKQVSKEDYRGVYQLLKDRVDNGLGRFEPKFA